MVDHIFFIVESATVGYGEPGDGIGAAAADEAIPAVPADELGVPGAIGEVPTPAAGDMGAKTRYRQADAPCVLQPKGDSHFDLHFKEPQWAVTPGQSAVLYDGEICLGGGVITTDAASA